MVGARSDGTVVLYDPRTLRSRGRTLPGAFGVPETLRFDRNDRRLLIESGDRTLRLVDVATGTQLGDPIRVSERAPLFGNGGLLLRGDGKEVSATVDTGIAIWDLDASHWKPAACAIAGRNLTRTEWHQYLGSLGPYRETCPGFDAAA